jgi:thymidylate kinase
MKKILYIHGAQGSGKTLAALLIRNLINKNHDTVLWTENHLSREVLRSVRPKLLIIDMYIFNSDDVLVLEAEAKRGEIQIILVSQSKPANKLHPFIVCMKTHMPEFLESASF